MNRLVSTVCALIMLIGCVTFPTVQASDVQEPLIAWAGDNDTHLYPDNYDQLARKYTAAKAAELRSFVGTSWKNDHVTCRIDMITKDSAVNKAELIPGDLIGANGSIEKSNITMTFMQDVLAVTLNNPEEINIFDLITHDNAKSLEAEKVYAAWIDIYIPKDTPAGIYSGVLTVKADGAVAAEFTYTLEVLYIILPDPDDWQSQLELWMYPYSACRYYSGLSSEEFFGITPIDGSSPDPSPLHYVYLDKKYEAALESQLELYRQAGGDTITVTAVHDAWNSQTPDPYPSMIKWTKKENGVFTYDYTDFDYWVELNMKHGIDGQIKTFSMAGIGWGIAYYDEASRSVTVDGAQPGSDRWRALWSDFLTDYMAHLTEKGWFDITYMAMDERPIATTLPVIELVNSIKNDEGKSLKISCAINSLELMDYFDEMDDLSVFSAFASDEIAQICEERRKAGLVTTMYTCGGGNVVTLCQPAEAAHAVYKAYRYNSDGVLRWAFDAFNADPLTSTYHTYYCPGDIYMIYPDRQNSQQMQAQTTPRYEKLTEGLRNMEKMRILRESAPEVSEAIDTLMLSVTQENMAAESAKVRTRVSELTKGAIALKNEYTDVDESRWYKQAVRFAIANGYMNGLSESTFAPDGQMTRAMFITVLARMHGAALDNSAASRFTDVPTGKWYSGAVVWGTKNGIIAGVSQDSFAPDGILTREQTATMLLRYAKRNKYDTTESADLSGYSDAGDIHDFATEAFAWANAAKIIRGTSATTLAPRDNCTRAQVAEMLRLFCANVMNKQ